ncbi:MAG TPA: GSU2403 family nucleotidyltransferase fold protein [bacterium]|nr:GSU2403 family nucleotidyltransferase fold protein [bacterium]
MPQKTKPLDLLLKVLEDLHDFLPYLVLVGGWVPYLYSRYLWKGVRHEPLSTMDIDFGFKEAPAGKSETIADCVRKKHYGEHLLSMDRSIPFVPVVHLGEEDLRADVEFITSPETSETVKKKLVGQEIKVNEIKDFGILLESPIMINVEGKQVNIPKPSIFTFHKLLTFNQRERPDKQQKDLYYAYYVLFFDPDKDRLVQEISDHIAKFKQGRAVKENVEKYFEDPYAKGPTFIMEGTGGSAMRTLIPDIRQDAYERISALINQ